MKHKVLYTASLIIIGISFGLVFVSIYEFVHKFSTSDFELANDPESWGQFGDYMGGTLNPLLAIINICVFVILTLEVQKLSDRNNEKSLETSRKIALMSLKHEELTHFKAVMDRNLENWRASPTPETFKNVNNVYHDLINRMLFLFPDLHKSPNHQSLKRLLSDALNEYEGGNFRQARLFKEPINTRYSKMVSDLSRWTVA
ncbi:MAG: hypothetical protein ACKVT2_15360 [Saprospiraceae bacterium]